MVSKLARVNFIRRRRNFQIVLVVTLQVHHRHHMFCLPHFVPAALVSYSYLSCAHNFDLLQTRVNLPSLRSPKDGVPCTSAAVVDLLDWSGTDAFADLGTP